MTLRRNLLALTAGTVAARTVLPVAARADEAQPDAELIRLCAAFDELEVQLVALHVGLETAEDEDRAQPAIDDIQDAQEPLLDRICELRATTLEGHRARGHSLRLWGDVEKKASRYGDWDDRLAWALVRDLTGEVPT